MKTGKHAELWPEKPAGGKEKKPGKGNNNEKENNDSKSGENSEEEEEENQAENNNNNNLQVKISSPRINGGNGGATVKFIGVDPVENKGGPTGGEKNNGGGGAGGGGGGQGGKKKKKKKKKNNNNSNAGPASNGAPASTGVEIPKVGFAQGVDQINPSPPQNVYHYPPSYGPQQQQAYVVSYNAAHPTITGASGYYMPPSPYMNASYAQPEDYLVHSEPLDSFEVLSDENPNGCYIM